jgi:hypothetical protein
MAVGEEGEAGRVKPALAREGRRCVWDQAYTLTAG